MIAAALVAGALLIATVTAIALIGGDDQPKALPAVSDQPIKPRHGETRTGAIYRIASPAVVSIRTDSGSGTGFVIDRDAARSSRTRTWSPRASVSPSVRARQRLDRGGRARHRPVERPCGRRDRPGKVPSAVKPLRLADSRTVRVGDVAIAIGNPFGLDRTATEGIVSGVGREIQAPNGFSIDSVIQTDAPINPGNSGGPLLNDSGRVIGVNSQIETGGSSGNVGVGFAVPSNAVRQVVPALSAARRSSAPTSVFKRTRLAVEPEGAEVQSVSRARPPIAPASAAATSSLASTASRPRALRRLRTPSPMTTPGQGPDSSSSATDRS